MQKVVQQIVLCCLVFQKRAVLYTVYVYEQVSISLDLLSVTDFHHPSCFIHMHSLSQPTFLLTWNYMDSGDRSRSGAWINQTKHRAHWPMSASDRPLNHLIIKHSPMSILPSLPTTTLPALPFCCSHCKMHNALCKTERHATPHGMSPCVIKYVSRAEAKSQPLLFKRFLDLEYIIEVSIRQYILYQIAREIKFMPLTMT